MVDSWLSFRQFGHALLQRIYPATCALCGDPGKACQDICLGCRRDLPWNHHACPRCAAALPVGSPNPLPCATCLRTPPAYDHAWSAFQYQGALRWLHRRLKFGQRLAHSRLLGHLLYTALATDLAQGRLKPPDGICVMPLHSYRLMRRGFNQSLELIRPAARNLQIKLDCHSLVRTRATRPQSLLASGQRRANVRGAFTCHRDWSGQHVALFDDVVTTGETVAEAARVLRRAGAREISVWSLARTAETWR
jgi:ComF family protein